MTALPPLTDEQWADLRHRFPADTYSTSFISMDGNYLPRSMVDTLRAAGVWCEHEADPSCADEGVRCVIRDAKEDVDWECLTHGVLLEPTRPPDGRQYSRDEMRCPVGGPAPVERFTTKRHSGRIAIYNNDAWVGDFFFENYGYEVAQEAADACVAILRRKHSELPAGVRDGRAAKLLRGDA